MQLGFVSAIFPDLTLEQVFEAARAAGYQYVELMCWPPGKAERRYAGVTHIDVIDFDDSAAEAVHKLAAKYDMKISGLGYYPNILSPLMEESEVGVRHLKRVVQAAKLLGLSVVSTFIGSDWHKSVDENWPQFLLRWKDIIDFAEAEGIQIAIENCPMLYTGDEWPGGKNLGYSPAIWRRMFRDIPNANFGLNYDPSHLVWQQIDYIAPLKEFASRIFRVHLKDAAVDVGKLNDVGVLGHPLSYHSPRIPGRGDVKWRAFLEAVLDSGYKGPLIVEVEDKDYEDTLEERKRSLLDAASYIRSVAPRCPNDETSKEGKHAN
jgi:sugar phosphate isomerase/epimerase